MTLNFDESIITGTRAISGSPAIRLRNLVIASTPSIRPVVHVDVDDLGAVLHLVAGDVERRGVVVVLDQPAELGRAGDVGPLADVDERDVVGEGERLEPGQLEARRARSARPAA